MEPCILRERDDNRWAIISGDCLLLDLEESYMYEGKGQGETWEYFHKVAKGQEEQFAIC